MLHNWFFHSSVYFLWNTYRNTYFKTIFLTDRTTLWREFIMHRVIAIEENSEQNLRIWPNLACFFGSSGASIVIIQFWLQCRSLVKILKIWRRRSVVCFFENDFDHTFPVNEELFRSIITNFFCHEFDDLISVTCGFNRTLLRAKKLMLITQ